MTVLQALDRYYDRMAARGDVVMPGWSEEPIGVVLELAEDGRLLKADSWLDDRNESPRIEKVPKWFTKQGQGSTPFLFWDNAAYVLGLPGKKDPVKTERDHAAFKELHLRELAVEEDLGLVALRRFLEVWQPTQAAPPGYDDKLQAFNIAFRLRGETRLLHRRPAAAIHVDRLRMAGEAAPEGFCLVRGSRLPLVRLHPKVKGIDGAASAEIPLVSFEGASFTSYGKKQGFNAPTCQVAAFRYGAALNKLLRRGGPNRLRIGDASIAFWADASAYDQALAEICAKATEDAFAGCFDDAPPPKVTTDAEQTQAVRAPLLEVAAARAGRGIEPAVLENVPFYVLGLAPNVARVAVRYWLSGSFATFADALDAHADAVAIEPRPVGWGAKPPSVQRLLLKTTALQEKYDNIPDGLAADLVRSVLVRTPYPRTWLAAIIIRLRAGDDPSRGWHAAAIKACLTRMRGASVPVGLDPDNPSQAYQLGRLFAVLERAQRAALGRNVNATIADRFFGAASSTPARVFPSLIRNGKVHAADVRRRGNGDWINRQIEEVIARLPTDLPPTLRLEDQGRFAVGYYHERAFRKAKDDDNASETSADDQETVS